MILLTVVAVGLLSLSSISLRSSSQANAMATARANARMALTLAIGELQKEAGTDQRVTARAEILDSTPDTPLAEGVKQKYWTGVWKTGSKQTEAQRTDSMVPSRALAARWLVSNPQPGSPTSLDPTGYTASTTGNSRDGIVIAKGLGADLADVTVPLVKVPRSSTTGLGGSYAYWVSDEGLKAKANLVDATFSSGLAAIDQLHHLAPQANAMHKVLPMVDEGIDFRKTPVENIAKLLTADTVKLLPNISMKSPLARYSPDFTVNSQGVIVDVRQGGLKKDLTAALEDPQAFQSLINNYGNGAAMLYRYSDSSANANPTVPSGSQPVKSGITDGLPWHSLYFHYNTYKAQMTPPVTPSGQASTAPTSSGKPETLPNVLSPRYYGVKLGGSSTKQAGIAPLPIAFRVDIAISSYNAGSVAAPAWRLRLHYYPQLVLYNPYAVRISASDYQFQRNFGAFATAGSYNTTSPGVTCIRVTSTAGAVTTTVPYSLVNQADAGRLSLKTKLGDCATLDPGETRVFALDADALKIDPKAAITFSDLVSNPGMSADYSQYCDLRTSVDATGKSSGAPFSTTDPNAVIRIELSAASLRCQAVDTFCNPPKYKWPDNDGSSRAQAGGSYQQAAAAGSWPSNLSISQMTNPRRIIGFYIRQKGLKQSNSTSTYSNAANRVPVFHGNFSQFTPLEDSSSHSWKEVYLSPFGGNYTNGQTDVQSAPSRSNPNAWETSFGDVSAGAGAVSLPVNRYILRDVPQQPLVSLGQFMHMPALNFETIGAFAYLGMGSMFVGGSLPSPVIPLDKNAMTSPTTSSTIDTVFLDDSFLANQALFDRFFFSTVPPAVPSPGTTWPDYWIDFNSANSGSELTDFTKPLLNGRIKPRSPAGKPLRMNDLRSVEKAAANLLLNGAFNVNSTSVGAWKALLGSLSGNKLRLFNATTGNPTTLELGTDAKKNPIPRFWSASANCNTNSAWDGLRVLNDTELNELAARIVEQVKLRGPFLSMADFLNRRLGPDGPLTRAGALQAAIDTTTTPDINATAKAAGVPAIVTGGTPAVIPGNLKDAKGVTLNTAVGMPGYLMQQDLIQAFSPAMTVRSDTFTIRASGQAVDATGRVIAQVFAEAVVQRLPEFLDGSIDAAESPLAGLTSLQNKTFGRRFEITSFRWLSPNEI